MGNEERLAQLTLYHERGRSPKAHCPALASQAGEEWGVTIAVLLLGLPSRSSRAAPFLSGQVSGGGAS